MGQPLPYIKISAIQSIGDPIAILTKIKTKFENFHQVKTEWVKSSEENAFLIFFPSYDAYYMAYKRDIPFYERFLRILIENPNFLKEPLLESSKLNPMDDPIPPYCILKYETNDKIPLRNYYQFIFQVGQQIGVQHSFEEIENGFILFYQ